MLSEAEREKCADILLAAERDRKQATQLSTHLSRHHHRGRLCDLRRS